MFEILSASVKTGFATLISMLCGTVTVKIIALVLGAEGVGLFSILKQTQQTGLLLATLGGQIPLVQGLASFTGKERQHYLAWTNLFFLAGAMLATVICVHEAPLLSGLIFGNEKEQTIQLVRFFSISITSGVIFAFFSGVLNGHHAIGWLASTQAVVAIIKAALAYPVARLVAQGHPAAFLASWTLSSAIGIGLASLLSARAGWLKGLWHALQLRFFARAFKHFFVIGATTLCTGFVEIAVIMCLKAFILKYRGLTDMGLFDVSWTLSVAPLMLMLSSFTTYFLPKLSSTREAHDRQLLIGRVIRLFVLLIVPWLTGVIALKPLLVRVFYSTDFMPSLRVLRWLLISDYFTVFSWIFMIPLLSYAKMKTYFAIEITSNAAMLFLSMLLVRRLHSLEGIGMGVIIAQLVTFIASLCYLHRRKYLMITSRQLQYWVIGLLIILGTSIASWNEVHVQWLGFVCVGLALLFSWFNLCRTEQVVWLTILSKATNRRRPCVETGF